MSIGKKLGGVRVTIRLKSYAAKVVQVRKKLYTVQNSGKHFDRKKKNVADFHANQIF